MKIAVAYHRLVEGRAREESIEVQGEDWYELRENLSKQLSLNLVPEPLCALIMRKASDDMAYRLMAGYTPDVRVEA